MRRKTFIGSLTSYFTYYVSIDIRNWSTPAIMFDNDKDDCSIELWVLCFNTSLHYNKKSFREEAYNSCA